MAIKYLLQFESKAAAAVIDTSAALSFRGMAGLRFSPNCLWPVQKISLL
jgi:hypothetical protein